MRKPQVRTIIAIFLILTAMLTGSYLYVDGHEIREIAAVSEAYTATVTKTHGFLDGRTSEYTLSKNQTQMLRNLIQTSHFTRKFSSDFSYTGMRDTYRVTLELIDSQGRQQDFLSLYCVEDLYLIIWATAPGSQDYALLIHNKDWHRNLEAILSESK